MDRVAESLARARAWVVEDERVRAALVHGSVVQGAITPLSDLDLIVVAEPGQRDAIWADRLVVTARLLGAPAAVTEVLPQRPYRWQARTAELDMLDFTVDEGYMAVWDGFEGPVEFLIDRADVQDRFDQDMAAQQPPPVHDAAADCDATWGALAKIAALLLHRRRQAVRTALNQLILTSLVPLLPREPFAIGHVGDRLDEDLLTALDRAHPSSSDPDELARALRASARWYAELLTEWARRTETARPTSALEPAVTAVIDQLLTTPPP